MYALFMHYKKFLGTIVEVTKILRLFGQFYDILCNIMKIFFLIFINYTKQLVKFKKKIGTKVGTCVHHIKSRVLFL